MTMSSKMVNAVLKHDIPIFPVMQCDLKAYSVFRVVNLNDIFIWNLNDIFICQSLSLGETCKVTLKGEFWLKRSMLHPNLSVMQCHLESFAVQYRLGRHGKFCFKAWWPNFACSTFCDNIMKTGGDKIEGEIDNVLDKIVMLFSYLSDKVTAVVLSVHVQCVQWT